MIIVPSKELAMQISTVANSLFHSLGVSTFPVIGGVNIHSQMDALKFQKPKILVANPKRLGELVVNYRAISMGNIRSVVLDEVDALLQEADSSSWNELQMILQSIPAFRKPWNSSPSSVSFSHHQPPLSSSQQLTTYNSSPISIANSSSSSSSHFSSSLLNDNSSVSLASSEHHRMLLFVSATANATQIDRFLSGFSFPHSIEKIAVKKGSKIPRSITHGLLELEKYKSLSYLQKILRSRPTVVSCLIFVKDSFHVESLTQRLYKAGIIAAPLSGETSKADRKVNTIH